MSSNPSFLTYGTIIIIDIDRMEEKIEQEGWSTYKPNPATGLLTLLVEELVRKWSAVTVYGLDYERGTEEVVIEVPLVSPEELKADLIKISKQMIKIGVTITIVAIEAPIIGKPAYKRKDAYRGPRLKAKRILNRIKRRGGSAIYINGELIRIKPQEDEGFAAETTADDMEKPVVDSNTIDDSRIYR